MRQKGKKRGKKVRREGRQEEERGGTASTRGGTSPSINSFQDSVTGRVYAEVCAARVTDGGGNRKVLVAQRLLLDGQRLLVQQDGLVVLGLLLCASQRGFRMVDTRSMCCSTGPDKRGSQRAIPCSRAPAQWEPLKSRGRGARAEGEEGKKRNRSPASTAEKRARATRAAGAREASGRRPRPR